MSSEINNNNYFNLNHYTHPTEITVETKKTLGAELLLKNLHRTVMNHGKIITPKGVKLENIVDQVVSRYEQKLKKEEGILSSIGECFLRIIGLPLGCLGIYLTEHQRIEHYADEIKKATHGKLAVLSKDDPLIEIKKELLMRAKTNNESQSVSKLQTFEACCKWINNKCHRKGKENFRSLMSMLKIVSIAIDLKELTLAAKLLLSIQVHEVDKAFLIYLDRCAALITACFLNKEDRLAEQLILKFFQLQDAKKETLKRLIKEYKHPEGTYPNGVLIKRCARTKHLRTLQVTIQQLCREKKLGNQTELLEKLEQEIRKIEHFDKRKQAALAQCGHRLGK